MDVNFCTICYRETNGSELYCSETCRLQDTPDDMRALSSVVPAPVSPTGDSGFAAAKRMGFRFRHYSGSSSDEEEDGNSAGSHEFILPATRNVIYGNGAVAAQGTTAARGRQENYYFGAGAKNHAANQMGKNNAANQQPQKGAFNMAKNNAAGANQDDYLDTEGHIFATLSKPTSLEHRHKQMEKEQRNLNKYIMKKGYPAAF